MWIIITVAIIVLVAIFVGSSNKEKNTKSAMQKSGLKESEFHKTESKYIGGHPKKDDVVEYVWYRIADEKLMFYERFTSIDVPKFHFDIPISSITDIQYNDATTMENKVTLGRVLLIGICALTWKKKKKNEITGVTIDWNDGKFNHSTTFSIEGKGAETKANALRNKLINAVNSVEKSQQ